MMPWQILTKFFTLIDSIIYYACSFNPMGHGDIQNCLIQQMILSECYYGASETGLS